MPANPTEFPQPILQSRNVSKTHDTKSPQIRPKTSKIPGPLISTDSQCLLSTKLCNYEFDITYVWSVFSNSEQNVKPMSQDFAEFVDKHPDNQRKLHSSFNAEFSLASSKSETQHPTTLKLPKFIQSFKHWLPSYNSSTDFWEGNEQKEEWGEKLNTPGRTSV